MLSQRALCRFGILLCSYASAEKQRMSETRRQLDESAMGGLPEFTEPRMASIPEGWFTMGSENGRDDERPAHRVWIDRLALAVYQVTRAEYAFFLRETRRAAPPFWNDPN